MSNEILRRTEMRIDQINNMNIAICEYFIGKDDYDLKYISDAQEHFKDKYHKTDVRNAVYHFVGLQLIWQAQAGRYARYITMIRGRRWIEVAKAQGFEI